LVVRGAVEQQIEDQRKLVAWWDENVSAGHGGDRSKYAERGTRSVTAEPRVGPQSLAGGFAPRQ
jgi:hypothetical protein